MNAADRKRLDIEAAAEALRSAADAAEEALNAVQEIE